MPTAGVILIKDKHIQFNGATNGDILTFSGGVLVPTAMPGEGLVSVHGSVTAGNLAAWHSSTEIKDGNVAVNNLVTAPTNITANSVVIGNGDKTVKHSTIDINNVVESDHDIGLDLVVVGAANDTKKTKKTSVQIKDVAGSGDEISRVQSMILTGAEPETLQEGQIYYNDGEFYLVYSSE